MAKQNETAGVFLQTSAGLVPFTGLTTQNLGADGGTFYASIIHGGKSVLRVSGDTEDKAMKSARQVIADIAERIQGSDKATRLVISL
jgi:hypothetical protein